MGNSQLKIEIYDWFGQCNDIEHVTWRVLDNDATLIGYLQKVIYIGYLYWLFIEGWRYISAI